MTAELVPVDTAALEVLPSDTQELAVTSWLAQARVALTHALESSDPEQMAHFKATLVTVADATKAFNLSKEVQADAQEMVRRAERGVGLAIRRGQADGTVASRGFRGHQESNRCDTTITPAAIPVPVSAIADQQSLAGSQSQAGIYDLTDDVDDEQFEQAIEDAKAEGNLSRMNVARKLGKKDGPAPKPAKGPERKPASDRIGKRYNGGKVWDTVPAGLHSLAGLCLGFNSIQVTDLQQVTVESLAEWSAEVGEALSALRAFSNRIGKAMS